MKPLSTTQRQRIQRTGQAAIAFASVLLLTGCMGRSPEMVNVEPSFVHSRLATPDERTAAAWPVMSTQQARAQQKSTGFVAEAAFLER